MKYRTWVAGLLLMSACVAAAAEPRAEPAPPAKPTLGLRNVIWFASDGDSLSLGLAYVQSTLKTLPSVGNDDSQITDNGAPSPVLEYNGAEKRLKLWFMKTGHIVIGWDYTASASVFSTKYQLLNSATQGDDIGTEVSGGYVAIAPGLYLKLGPLYPGMDFYWKTSASLGPSAFLYSGDACFSACDTAAPIVEDVGSHDPRLALYGVYSLQLLLDQWTLELKGKNFFTFDQRNTTFETYSLGLAYRIPL